jgi:hypothetical protein
MVLNVSANCIDSLQDLKCLAELTILLASHNQLVDFQDIGEVFDNMPYLWKVDLYGNPCCSRAKYRDRIITMVRGLGVLDGRDVTDTERRFLKNWQAMREGRMKSDHSRLEPEGTETEGIPTAKKILQFLHQSRPPPTMPPLPQRPPLKGPYGKGSSRSGTFITGGAKTDGVKGGSSRLPPVFEENTMAAAQSRLPHLVEEHTPQSTHRQPKPTTRLPQLQQRSPMNVQDQTKPPFLRVAPPVAPMVS